MKIFVRFGHDTINGSDTIAPGERAIIQAYAPTLADTLYRAGHNVMTYSSTYNKYTTLMTH